MMQIPKLIYYLLRELIFDSRDEYDFKSTKFNTRKFIAVIIVTLSIILNLWLIYRFTVIADELLECREKVDKHLQEPTKEPVHEVRCYYTYKAPEQIELDPGPQTQLS